MTTILPLSGMLLALTVASPGEAPSYVETRIEVDIDPLIAGSEAKDPEMERTLAEGVRDEVVGRLGDAFEEHEVPLVKADAEAVVRIGLEWKVYLDSHYQVRIEVERDGSTEVVSESLECVLCDGPKLAELLAKQVPGLVERLEVKPAEPAPVDAPTEDALETSDPPPQTPEADPEPRGRKIGPIGYAGIGGAVLGTAGVVVGAVHLARGEQTALEPDLRFERVDDFRPAGAVFLGVGGAVLLTGVALIVVDQTAMKKRRAVAAKRHVLSPSFHAHGAGISLTARF